MLVPPESRLRTPGLDIHLRRGGRYREVPESSAFPGWRSEEIYLALIEGPLSPRARPALERVARAMGAREGTRPEDDPITRSISRRAEERGKAQGRREGRREAYDGQRARGAPRPWYRGDPCPRRGSGAVRRVSGRRADGRSRRVPGRSGLPPPSSPTSSDRSRPSSRHHQRAHRRSRPTPGRGGRLRRGCAEPDQGITTCSRVMMKGSSPGAMKFASSARVRA